MQTLGALVDPVIDPVDLDPDREYQFLRITYAGIAERGETALGREVSYATISHATAGDIVVSHINAVNGAICVMPDGMADVLVSNEFTVIRLKPDTNADPHYLWSILRTSGVVAEWLSGASGVGRHRVTWDTLKDQHVPLLQPPERQTAIGSLYREAISREAEAEALREEALGYIAGLDLEGDAAQDRLARAKPPR